MHSMLYGDFTDENALTALPAHAPPLPLLTPTSTAHNLPD